MHALNACVRTRFQPGNVSLRGTNAGPVGEWTSCFLINASMPGPTLVGVIFLCVI